MHQSSGSANVGSRGNVMQHCAPHSSTKFPLDRMRIAGIPCEGHEHTGNEPTSRRDAGTLGERKRLVAFVVLLLLVYEPPGCAGGAFWLTRPDCQSQASIKGEPRHVPRFFVTPKNLAEPDRRDTGDGSRPC